MNESSEKLTAEEGLPLPGPIRWPIFGSLFHLLKYKERVLMTWADIYGPIFTFKLGSLNVVAVNGYDAVKEVLMDDTYSSREEKYIFQRYRKPGQGLFFCPNNQIHRKLKPFLLNNIKLLQNETESNIEAETMRMIEYFHKFPEDETVDLQEGVGMTIANILLKTLYSTSYPYDSVELKSLMQLCCIGRSARDKKVAMVASLQWLQYIPGANSVISEKRGEHLQMKEIFGKLLKERESRGVEEINDLSSAFLHASVDESDREQFLCLSEDSMTGGTQTTKSQFLWILLELLKHPQYIPMLEKEMQQVFGTDTDKYFDRQLHRQLHLTRAVIEEGLRLRPIAPTSVFHVPHRSSTFRGFHIPHGVAIMPNIWSVHRDREYWDPDPDHFRPERHLDGDRRFVTSGHVLTFSAGRRKCGGTAIVDRILVSFLVAMVTNFRMELVVDDDATNDGESILIYRPPAFRVRMTSRHHVMTTTST